MGNSQAQLESAFQNPLSIFFSGVDEVLALWSILTKRAIGGAFFIAPIPQIREKKGIPMSKFTFDGVFPFRGIFSFTKCLQGFICLIF
jgi:hypothetical protein